MRRLRVVSWNVGRLYTPSDNNRLDGRDVPRVAQVLDELDADVALLQELVDQSQLAALLARLPEHEGRIAERCEYDRHVAILVRRRLRPAFEQHLLMRTGRGVVSASFDVGAERGSAHPLHFDVFDRRRRRAQAEEIAQLTDGRDEAFTVIGGDFNLDPELAQRLDSEDAVTFGLLLRRFRDAGRGAGPTLLGLLRVDHLLVRGRKIARTWSAVSPNRRLPMGDHDPLICDVDLN
jgi:endonuclease/exonuclease/phosphatase family metal-dependent hydrolase